MRLCLLELFKVMLFLFYFSILVWFLYDVIGLVNEFLIFLVFGMSNFLIVKFYMFILGNLKSWWCFWFFLWMFILFNSNISGVLGGIFEWSFWNFFFL